MIGTWIQCSTQGIGPEDAAGIEIAPDGEYTILIRRDGRLVRGVGVLHEGHVELDMNQVHLVSAGGYEETRLLFSDEVPYRMCAFNTDFIGYDYIR